MTPKGNRYQQCSDLGDFCAGAFASLGRADQRNAAETYVRGLLNCRGRKTIPRLAAAWPGRSEQSLQQFINQSPWDHAPVRKWLADRLVREFQPEAWVVDEVAFPKHGRYSAAVERQYVHSHGRVRNCQLAITVGMHVNGVTVPVNWNLTIPESWGNDLDRRARAKLPEHELPRPYWQYHVELLDDMALDWGTTSAPIVFDARNRTLEWYLSALELRGQTYMAQVGPNETVSVAESRRSPGIGHALPTQSSRAVSRTIGELAARVGNVMSETAYWRGGNGNMLRSQFLTVPLQSPPGEHVADSARARPVERVLIVEWPLGKPQPRGYWLTNIRGTRLQELVALAKKTDSTAPRVDELAKDYGLFDYEGRTFSGWHHHVTLVGAAYIHDVLHGPSARAGALPAAVAS